jgi:hypothetical protein
MSAGEEPGCQPNTAENGHSEGQDGETAQEDARLDAGLGHDDEEPADRLLLELDGRLTRNELAISLQLVLGEGDPQTATFVSDDQVVPDDADIDDVCIKEDRADEVLDNIAVEIPKSLTKADRGDIDGGGEFLAELPLRLVHIEGDGGSGEESEHEGDDGEHHPAQPHADAAPLQDGDWGV